MKKIFVVGICLLAVSAVFAQSGNNSDKIKAGQTVAPAPAAVAPTAATTKKNNATIILMPSPSQIIRSTAPEFKKQKAITILPAEKKN
jgi:hypothetical protein